MGTSKRIAEYVVDWGARQARDSQVFVSVRFGNVLGSRGSVIPKFKSQIKRGGPVTVTHPEMTRYFMTIPEASQLVLQAAGQAENGCIYVLDMGEPVRILDMARDLIKLSGLEPDRDIKIVFSGIRPGEKLYEELLTAEEGTSTTKHDKIFVAHKNGLPTNDFELALENLFEAAGTGDPCLIRNAFKTIVPSYQYDPEDGQEETEKVQSRTSEKEVI
jgi:FlaA1/EpsC-like NDP-sugar epimerase